MSTTPQSPQSQRGSYPGLRPAEANVLRDWLGKHEGEYDRFDYNVRVGGGTDPGESFDAAVRKSFIESTQSRIDVIAWRHGFPVLIEVKERATAAAIGQLTVYSHLFADAYPSAPKPTLLVIAYTAVTGIPEAMRRAGIVYEQVIPSA